MSETPSEYNREDEAPEGRELPPANTTSPDGFTDAAASPATPVTPVATDALGTDRIASPASASSWKPAEVDPDPAEVARMAEFNARSAQAVQDRRTALSSGPVDETAQPLIDANAARDEEHARALEDRPDVEGHTQADTVAEQSGSTPNSVSVPPTGAPEGDE